MSIKRNVRWTITHYLAHNEYSTTTLIRNKRHKKSLQTQQSLPDNRNKSTHVFLSDSLCSDWIFAIIAAIGLLSFCRWLHYYSVYVDVMEICNGNKYGIDQSKRTIIFNLSSVLHMTVSKIKDNPRQIG